MMPAPLATALGGAIASVLVDDARVSRRRHPKEIARLVAAALVVVALVAFVLDNRHPVRVGFIFTESETRLIWVLLLTALLGAVADRLVRRRRSR